LAYGNYHVFTCVGRTIVFEKVSQFMVKIV